MERKQRRRQEKAKAKVEAKGEAEGRAEKLYLNYLYAEHRGEWEIPLPLVNGTVGRLMESPRFVQAFSEIFSQEKSGIPDSLDLHRCTLPEFKEEMPVQQFVQEGGLVLFHPVQPSSDELWQQAKKLQALCASKEYEEYFNRFSNGRSSQPSQQSRSQPSQPSSQPSQQSSSQPSQPSSSQPSQPSSSSTTDNNSIKELVLAATKDVYARIEEVEKKLAAQGCTIHVLKQTVASMEHVFIRKLIDAFRKKASSNLVEAGMEVHFNDRYPDEPDRQWWQRFCDDSKGIELLAMSSGIPELDAATLQLTKFDVGSLQSRGGIAAHNITEDKSLYATLVCQFQGARRERMMYIYKLVFGGDAESDALFDNVACCDCPVHCPNVPQGSQQGSQQEQQVVEAV